MNDTHDIFVRMTVRKTVTGTMTPEKKHKAVTALKHIVAANGPGYTVVSAEVAAVTKPDRAA
jgi:hypothetical protein